MAVIPPTSASVFLLLALLSVPLCRSAEPQEAAEAEEPEYKRYVKEEHQYYHLHLYQDNYDGAYDRHLVDLKADPEARTHEFLSGHSQAAEAVSLSIGNAHANALGDVGEQGEKRRDRSPAALTVEQIVAQIMLRGAKDMLRNSFLYLDSPSFFTLATPIL